MKYLLTLFLCIASIVHMHAQSLSLFDVDASNFPTMKAKFYAFDAAGKQVRPSSSELSMTEKGQPRTITSVSCPPPVPLRTVSVAMSIDVSGSMGGSDFGEIPVELGKLTASTLCNQIAMPPSEFALQTCNDRAYILQDFTTDKNKILKALTPVTAGGGNDFVEHLLNKLAGLLNVAKYGKFKKVAVLYTDAWWDALQPSELQACLDTCKKYNIEFYAVIYSRKEAEPNGIKASLQQLANQTGGYLYDGITSKTAAEDIAGRIQQVAQGGEPCEITWESVVACQAGNTNVELTWQMQKAQARYPTPASAIASLKITPAIVAFGKRIPSTQTDTTLILTALNADFTITEINRKYGTAEFTVVNTTFPLSIPKNGSKTITLRFAPSDSGLKYASFEISTDKCSGYFSTRGGFPGKKATASTLKLTKPNGGEVFAVGSDTLITWEGISPTDTVSLEFSADNGSTWNLLTTEGSGLKYTWKNVPKPPSAKCLVRMKQEGKEPIEVSPFIEWQKSLGGSRGDLAQSIQQCTDSGYIVAGYSYSNDGDVTVNHGATDYWVVKLSPTGAIEWQKSLGGSGVDFASSIQQCTDGGYIVAGLSTSNDGDVTGNHGDQDYWVVKLSPAGDIEWQKALGGSRTDNAFSIQQCTDGGYIVAGLSFSKDGDVTGSLGIAGDYWVVKLNSVGAEEWQKSLGGSNSEWANSIQQSTDGGYIVAGFSNSNDGDVTGNHGDYDYWVVKLSPLGAIEWQKSLGGIGFDRAQSIQQSADDGYIVAGYSNSNDGDVTGNHGSADYWVVKLSPIGAIEWQKSLGGNEEDQAQSIQQSADGGYIVAGFSSLNDGDVTGNHGGRDYWVVKLSPAGAVEWQKSLGGSRFDMPHSIQQSADGGYIVAGYSGSKDGEVTGNHGDQDYWVVKLSPDGVVLQSDISDATFSIVTPMTASQNVDMRQCLVGAGRDSVVSTFVQNTGTFPFRVDSIIITGADASQFSLVSGIPPFSVPSGSSRAVEFHFAPTSIGVKTAQIVIYTQADTLLQTIQGEGIAPTLSVIGDIIDFGRVEVGKRKDTMQVVTIKNTGTVPLNITATRHAGPNDVDFTTLSGGGNFVVNQGDTARFDLRFAPKSIGRTSGRLLFEYNGFGSPASVQLYGEGTFNTNNTARTTVVAQDITAQAGEKVHLTLKLQKSSGMEIVGAPTEWYARIHYNKSILYNVQTDNQCLGTTDSCMLELSGVYDPKSEDLITIPCITTLGNTDHSMIVIDTFLWMNSGIITEVATQNGTITLNGVCDDGGVRLFIPANTSTSLSTRPNPVQDKLQIHYGLREPLTVTLELLSMTGQVVQTILTNQSQVSGQYTLTSDLRLFGNGVYLLRMRTNKEMLTTRVDVVR